MGKKFQAGFVAADTDVKISWLPAAPFAGVSTKVQNSLTRSLWFLDLWRFLGSDFTDWLMQPKAGLLLARALQ